MSAPDTGIPPTSPSVPPVTEGAKLGALARLVGVFVSPGETFADIAKAPSFWLPMIVVAVLGCSILFTAAQRIGMEQMIRKEMAPYADKIPPDRFQEAVDRNVKFFWTRYIAAFVITPVIFLAAAGVILLMGNFVFGGSASFKQMFAVVTHGWLPGAVNALLGVAVLLIRKDPEEVDIQNLTATNLGMIVSKDTSKFLHSLATSFDLFSFWQIFLIATGLAAAAKLGFNKSLWAVVIPWILLVLIKCGFVAAFT